VYKIGVKYIHAIITIESICSKSLKNTLSAEKIRHKPITIKYSRIITIGKNKIYQLSPIPDTINAIKTIIILNNIFINALLATESGIIIRGK
jgi:hypothetical protein